MAANEVRVVEADSHQYHVEVVIDGSVLPTRHGPYPTADEAEGAAVHLASIARAMGQNTKIVIPATRQVA